MSPRWNEILQHAARIALWAMVLALAGRHAGPIAIVIASGGLFFAAFALVHDAAHGALGLPRRANEIALAAAGALLLMSGHALRSHHLRHHARCMEDDDDEGAPARLPLARALAGAPAHALGLRVRALRGAGARGRRWQIAEGAVDALAIGLLVASGAPAAIGYAAVALVAQLGMAVWAAHVPHNAPAWLVALARRVAATGSPVALSLAYHGLHHARPDVPTARLHGAAARCAARS